jgi:hypothetical protein
MDGRLLAPILRTKRTRKSEYPRWILRKSVLNVCIHRFEDLYAKLVEFFDTSLT